LKHFVRHTAIIPYSRRRRRENGSERIGDISCGDIRIEQFGGFRYNTVDKSQGHLSWKKRNKDRQQSL